MMRILVVFLAIHVMPVYAQEVTSSLRSYGWLSGGLLTNGDVIGGAMSLSFQDGSRMAIATFGGAASLRITAHNFNEVGFLVGRASTSPHAHASYAIGLAFAEGKWEDSDEDFHSYHEVGLTMQGELILAPVSSVGLGLRIQGTIRKHSPGLLVGLTINLGKVAG